MRRQKKMTICKYRSVITRHSENSTIHVKVKANLFVYAHLQSYQSINQSHGGILGELKNWACHIMEK